MLIVLFKAYSHAVFIGLLNHHDTAAAAAAAGLYLGPGLFTPIEQPRTWMGFRFLRLAPNGMVISFR